MPERRSHKGFPFGRDDLGSPILHVDMDSFYASVEVVEDPRLEGKPVVVGGRSARGVVTAATYEARDFGIRAGMPSMRARALCPHAVFLPGRRDLYLEYSRRVMEILSDFTPHVEPISIDEAFLDVAGAGRWLGSPVVVAQELRRTVRAETGLPASVGIASTKTLAKIASGKAKPDGLFLVPAKDAVRFLHSLDISDLPGVGRRTQEVLRGRGINTIGQLASVGRFELVEWLGEAQAHRLGNLAWNRDRDRVGPKDREKSISTERTFETNILDKDDLKKQILRSSHQCATRLRKAGLVGWTVTLKLKDPNFVTRTRSRTLIAPTDVGREIAEAASDLLDSAALPGGGVRLLGVGVSGLVGEEDGVATLLDHDPKPRAAEQVMDLARKKFGGQALKPASLLDSQEPRRSPEGGLAESRLPGGRLPENRLRED